jgi:hypothetical protein
MLDYGIKVVPHEDGGWKVMRGTSGPAVSVHPTHDAAEDVARQLRELERRFLQSKWLGRARNATALPW